MGNVCVHFVRAQKEKFILNLIIIAIKNRNEEQKKCSTLWVNHQWEPIYIFHDYSIFNGILIGWQTA